MSTITEQSAVYRAINWIYRSYNQAKPHLQNGPDAVIRHPEWTRRMLDALGAPDRKMYNIAVTGSKGKGSHAILTAAILESLGFKVGLFTGPHLVDFMERFRINGRVMPEEQFVCYVDRLRVLTEDFQLPKDQYFGPVGLLAVIAIEWFLANATDINVMELGRGALHDDVNQVEHVGAIIAPVFLEHRRELGDTLEAVGGEKAGIVTEATRWICTHQQAPVVESELRRAITTHLRSSGSDLDVDDWHGKTMSVLGKDFFAQDVVVTEGAATVSCIVDGQSIRLCLPAEDGLPPAEFIVDNAAVALRAAVNIAADLRPAMEFPEVIDLRDIRLPGRLQTISHRPRVMVDGTIHGKSAQFIRDYIALRREQGFHGRIGACVGIPADKDGAGVLRALQEYLDFVVICKAHNAHLKFDESLENAAKTMITSVQSAEYLEEAIELSMRMMDEQTDLLFILGTQSFVGDAMRFFQVDTRSIWNCRH